MSEDRDRKPTGKGPLKGVKCKQRKAYTSAIPSLIDRFLDKNPALLPVPLLFSPFAIF